MTNDTQLTDEIRNTIDYALCTVWARATRGSKDERDIDAAMDWLKAAQPTAPQPTVVPDYERTILVMMVDDIKAHYPSGSEAWARAVTIEAWLDNYSGMGSAELEKQWPDMPDLQGVDVFSHLPISGKPEGVEIK